MDVVGFFLSIADNSASAAAVAADAAGADLVLVAVDIPPKTMPPRVPHADAGWDVASASVSLSFVDIDFSAAAASAVAAVGLALI